jgi:hypothetical protein
VDSCVDVTARFGIRFEDPRWSAHVGSLKPLGLACALGTSAAAWTGGSGNNHHGSSGSGPAAEPAGPPADSAFGLLSKSRSPPECMRNFAWTIGFAPADVDGFTVLGRASIVGRATEAQVTRGPSWSVVHSRPTLECAVLAVPEWQQPVGALAGEGVHVLCWGHPSLLLPFCNEYWDGESIWVLDRDSARVVHGMHAQWSKEDFDCVGGLPPPHPATSHGRPPRSVCLRPVRPARGLQQALQACHHPLARHGRAPARRARVHPAAWSCVSALSSSRP